ncbi:hypothetical protein FVE85_5141 [Porphyridium purpureum]|uniref:Uncharacterized protein n=1 Tax=Porphyridium purpureum TaxID=35688 RepID=A0A5J4Z1Q7_PORPP|nr:hypothetical protein FVE85_5141 [Porphyridium purpureum]|eukprot:POR6568..scf295_1
MRNTRQGGVMVVVALVGVAWLGCVLWCRGVMAVGRDGQDEQGLGQAGVLRPAAESRARVRQLAARVVFEYGRPLEDARVIDEHEPHRSRMEAKFDSRVRMLQRSRARDALPDAARSQSILASQRQSQAETVQGSASVFQIAFAGSVPSDARNALREAVQAWADVWPATDGVTLRIEIDWTVLPTGVLAAAGSVRFVPGDGDPLQDNTAYSIAMARSITGDDFGLSSSLPDVSIAFNSRINWNTDTSRAPSAFEYDLETVMLHELAHGLFMDGAVQLDPRSNVVAFGRLGTPARYDNFLGVFTGTNEPESCENGSTTVPADAITSDRLFFMSSNRFGGGNFSLYAPSTYQPGSSVYHFAEDERVVLSDCEGAGIPKESCSDLMTPALPPGYIQHAIGRNTLRLMNSMISTANATGNGFCFVPGGGSSDSDDSQATRIIFISAAALAGVVVLLVGALLIRGHVQRKRAKAEQDEQERHREAAMYAAGAII